MTFLQQHYDLPKLLFVILFIFIMIIASFWVMEPFILGFAWAGMVVIATWPLLLKLETLLWGRRYPAVMVMTLLLILLFVIPITLLINGLLDSNAPLAHWAENPLHPNLPDLSWLNSIPMIGGRLYSGWNSLIAGEYKTLLAKVQPYIGATATWLVAQAAHIGRFLIHLTLMVLFSIILYCRGEKIGLLIRHFAIRLGDKRGDAVVILTAQAIRAVALGVVVTALLQAVLGGIGLAVCSIPYTMLLTVLMFICCVAQLGPLLVLVPAIIWLYWNGDTALGTVLLVWSAILSSLDGILRPILIRRGANLPMILILLGVIGGLLSFGMIGLFIGPVVLAVSYRLISAWINEVPAPQPDFNLPGAKVDNPETAA